MDFVNVVLERNKVLATVCVNSSAWMLPKATRFGSFALRETSAERGGCGGKRLIGMAGTWLL